MALEQGSVSFPNFRILDLMEPCHLQDRTAPKAPGRWEWGS